MNDNIRPEEVKKNSNILAFPEVADLRERIGGLEFLVSNLQSTVTSLQSMVARLQTILYTREGNSLRSESEEAREPIMVPETRPLPEADKTLDRVALCGELIRVLLSLDAEVRFGASLKAFFGKKKGVARVYFTQDNSYLYFDKHGRLWAENREDGKKTTLAHRLLNRLIEMREHLDSPIVTAALTKSVFNAFVRDPADPE